MLTRRAMLAAAAAAAAACAITDAASGQSHTPEDPVNDTEHMEIAVVGGGPAGLSAALTLGRARRRVIVFDAGEPRNAPSPHAHNFFTRDGTSPAELSRIGREQLKPYETVEVRGVRITDARRTASGFELTGDDGRRVAADRVILATGVVDELPDVPGLRELWGKGVFHCPYCHGWEVRGEPFVLIAQSPSAAHVARLLRGWASTVTVCLMRPGLLDDEERRALAELGVEIVDQPVIELVAGPGDRVVDVVLADKRRLGPAAVFTSAPLRQRSALPAALGCKILTEGPFTGLVDVDERGFTGVPGLYAVGDASRGFTQIVNASYEGANAAAAINNELLLAGRLPSGAAKRE